MRGQKCFQSDFLFQLSYLRGMETLFSGNKVYDLFTRLPGYAAKRRSAIHLQILRGKSAAKTYKRTLNAPAQGIPGRNVWPMLEQIARYHVRQIMLRNIKQPCIHFRVCVEGLMGLQKTTNCKTSLLSGRRKMAASDTAHVDVVRRFDLKSDCT